MTITKKQYEDINYGDRILTITNRIVELSVENSAYVNLNIIGGEYYIYAEIKKSWGTYIINEEIKAILNRICKLKRKK